MRIIKIKKNRNIIRYRDDYFVVDDKSAHVFDCLDKTINVKDFASQIMVPIKKAQKILSKIKTELSKNIYYKKNLFLNIPIKVQWKITNQCNLRCRHCYLGDLSQKSLSKEELKKIAEKIIKAGVMEVTITGGEALLVPNLLEIIEEFVKNQIYVKIFTNGTLILPFLEKLENSYCKHMFKKFLTFSLSVDGLKLTHDEIRGKGTFEVVQTSIKKLVEVGFAIVVNCVVNKINYNEIPQLLLLLNNMGVKNIQLSNIIIRGKANMTMSLTQAEKMLLIEKVKNIAENNNIHVLYGEEDGINNVVYKDNKIINGYFVEDWKCCAGVTRMTVDFDGKVYCCPFCKDFSLGNILNQDIFEIWENQNRFRFLDNLSKTKQKSGRMCIMTGGYEIG